MVLVSFADFMAVSKDKVKVATYIHRDLKKRLEEAAELENRSLSNYIEMLIRKDVEKKE